MNRLTDLELLSAFVAVAEERHFGRAAARLHVAQPVVSRRIQRLERETGLELVERSTRHVGLTEAGEVFLESARRLLHDADLAIGQARRVAEGEAGRLTVGFVDSAAFELLADLLRQLERDAPGMVLDLRELPSERQLAQLHSDIDVAIVRELRQRDFDEEGFESRHLLEERLHVALPMDHRLAAQPAVLLRSLAEQPFVMFPRPQVPRGYDHIISVCERAGFTPWIAAHALQYTSMLAFVAAGLGAALLPTSARAIRPDTVALVPIADHHATTSLSVAWLARHSATVETFVATARRVAAEHRAADGDADSTFRHAHEAVELHSPA